MAVNHKRVWRIYQEAGLAVKRKKRKRLVREAVPREAATAANEEWALDFISDVLATGRSVRMLSVVDTFTRECVAREADTSFASRRVTGVLERAVRRRGWPQRIKCDNGPELTRYAALRVDLFVNGVLEEKEWPIGNFGARGAKSATAGPEVSEITVLNHLSDNEPQSIAREPETVSGRPWPAHTINAFTIE